MSIENTLERIAAALEKMTGAAPAATAPAQPAAPAATAPAQPAAPATPPASGAPFTDNAGLLKYVTETYQGLGPDKGMKIQEIMTSMGVANINDMPVEHYGAFYTAVEQLKAT